MRVISSPHVAEQAVLASLRDAFGDLSRSETLAPGQFVIDLPGGGDVIHYPAVLPHAGVYAVKVSPYLPDPAGPAVVTAWTMLVSLSTGQPVALLDASGLTVERTAATTVLAADLLLPPGAATAAVIGYGRIGLAHARYLRHLRPDMTVRAFSPGGIDEVDDGVRAVASIHDAVTGADLVMLCTSAADDVLDPRTLPPGTVVTSISTNAPGAREILPAAVPELDVYVDARTSLQVASELAQAAAAGWDPATVRGDLAGLVAGHAPRPSGERPVYFRSVGLGIEDAAVAWAACRNDDNTTKGRHR
ncbi:ornithine cyclodeaminase family protein [Streptomyces sp. Ag109_G2-15]|uniref:ornithine cyclodeaminase family protein n=1 Tax=Streptomyces sp. Ag109_G2-15 TaxID=1938850 RepID=UPI000BCF3239|nr:ornithine cyclodeaminase family protein [Streptomyces sp. Ag109_G2-15]SOD91329.1 ornithine cyclodeaminase [Streptomyces sp. Ag109_G2-15]